MISHTNNSNLELGSLELPESDINGDTTLTLGLQLVQDPRILKGTLAKFGSFLKTQKVSYYSSTRRAV